jgi:hypothetical protein
MPVRKFRSPEEMERSLHYEPGDPRIWDALRRRWTMHCFFAARRVPAAYGVFRYRSIDEKQRRQPPMITAVR